MHLESSSHLFEPKSNTPKAVGYLSGRESNLQTIGGAYCLNVFLKHDEEKEMSPQEAKTRLLFPRQIRLHPALQNNGQAQACKQTRVNLTMELFASTILEPRDVIGVYQLKEW